MLIFKGFSGVFKFPEMRSQLIVNYRFLPLILGLNLGPDLGPDFSPKFDANFDAKFSGHLYFIYMQ